MRTAMWLGVSMMLGVTAAVVSGEVASTSPAPGSRPAPLTGHLTRVHGNSLVISTGNRLGGKQEITVLTDSKTDFLVDNELGKLTDLKPGMTVFVTSERARNPAGFVVRVLSPNLAGTVSKIDGTTIVLRVQHPRKPPTEVSVATDRNTRILFPGRTGKLEDLKAGMKLQVRPETGTAATVFVGPSFEGQGNPLPAPNEPGVKGTLLRLDGKDMVIRSTLTGGATEDVRVATDDHAEFLVEGEVGRLVDLRPGMRVFVTRLPDRPGRHPAMVTVEAISAHRTGRVVKVDGPRVVLKVSKAGAEAKEVVVDTDEETKIVLLCMEPDDWWFRPRAGHLADLKTDMSVRVLPETGKASKIIGYLVARRTTQPASRPSGS